MVYTREAHPSDTGRWTQTTTSEQRCANAVALVQDTGLTLPVLLDATGAQSLAHQMDVVDTAVILIDHEGRICYRRDEFAIGDVRELRHQITVLLANEAAARVPTQHRSQ